jgi:putative transcriptional regulator
MKVVRSNLSVLAAQKGQRERRRISLRTVADETGISRYTVYAIAGDNIREYPKEVLETLCTYFDCTVCDLLLTEESEVGHE